MDKLGCGCIVIAIWFLLKVWAAYYVINDVLIVIARGEEISFLKVAWAIILVIFIVSRKISFKINFK